MWGVVADRWGLPRRCVLHIRDALSFQTENPRPC